MSLWHRLNSFAVLKIHIVQLWGDMNITQMIFNPFWIFYRKELDYFQPILYLQKCGKLICKLIFSVKIHISLLWWSKYQNINKCLLTQIIFNPFWIFYRRQLDYFQPILHLQKCGKLICKLICSVKIHISLLWWSKYQNINKCLFT